MTQRIIFSLLMLTVMSGCVATVSEGELRDFARTAQGDTLGMVHYLGRDDAYDYFRIHFNVGSKRVRIPAPNRVVTEPHPFGEKEKNAGLHALDGWLP